MKREWSLFAYKRPIKHSFVSSRPFYIGQVWPSGRGGGIRGLVSTNSVSDYVTTQRCCLNWLNAGKVTDTAVRCRKCVNYNVRWDVLCVIRSEELCLRTLSVVRPVYRQSDVWRQKFHNHTAECLICTRHVNTPNVRKIRAFNQAYNWAYNLEFPTRHSVRTRCLLTSVYGFSRLICWQFQLINQSFIFPLSETYDLLRPTIYSYTYRYDEGW